jgi:hypothetical protein
MTPTDERIKRARADAVWIAYEFRKNRALPLKQREELPKALAEILAELDRLQKENAALVEGLMRIMQVAAERVVEHQAALMAKEGREG